jgi:phospholipid/cholesterol/gamma-HCH transport system substrate-binding protein
VFQNAGQLVKDDDVQVGGRRIGSVREITLDDDNRARVRVEIQEPYAPLREGTTAVIRLTSLSGIANRYISLTPAPNSAKELDDGTHAGGRLDHRRRRPRPALQRARPEGAQGPPGCDPGLRHQYDGRGKEAGESAGVLQPVPVDLAAAGQPAHRGRGRRSPTSSSTRRAP